jgi:hypothetical protein
MKLADLITDCGTGQCSHTKLWANVAYCAATLAFLRHALFTAEPPSAEIWLIYLGVVGVHNGYSKLLSMKYGRPS